MLKCKLCKKEIHKTPSILKRNKLFYCSVKCCSQHRKDVGYSKGPNNGRWNGGRQNHNGYVRILLPSHPKSVGKGYIYEHRVVVEKEINRYLHSKEQVHHINGKKDDNRIENLMVFKNPSYHKWFHIKGFCSLHGIVYPVL